MLVGSGYLHTLKLVSLVRALLVRVVRAGWKWLPACLEPCALCFVLVGSDYLHTLNLVPAGSCALWCVLVGVSWLVWLPAYLEPCACWFVCLVVCPGWCVLVGVVTCIP